MMKNKHSIYLHRVGAIGDTLLTSNLRMHLKSCYKEPKISMGAIPDYALPLLKSGLISEVIDATRVPYHFLETPYSTQDALTRELQKYDTVIIFKKDKNQIIKNRIENTGIQDFAIESPFPPERSNIHVSKWLERVFKQLKHKKNKYDKSIKLPISKETSISSASMRKKLKLNSPYLALHPGSGSRKKCAPIKKIIKIAKEIVDSYNLQVALIEGFADKTICDEFRKNWPSKIINVKVNSLDILVGILVKAEGFLGCDSGISHLSSLYGVPSLVLFGPYSNPIHWHPIGMRSEWTYWNNVNDCKIIFERLIKKN